MLPPRRIFDRSIQRQMEINAARTPTERFLALCDLLDDAHAMAPTGPEAEQRERQIAAERLHNRERLREQFTRILARQGKDAPTGL